MVVCEDESEITVEMKNLPDSSARTAASNSHSDEDGAAAPGGKLLRCVAVSFCLLCVLQVALNISLRLALSSQQISLMRELDELKRKLNDSASLLKMAALQQSSLTTDRDDLKRKLNDFALQQSSLTTERDDLKRKLNDFAHYLNQGWVYFSGSFYYISSVKTTWQDSRDDCVQRGADLVIINSNEEQNFLEQFKKILWIGLTDRETAKIWKWVDGTLLTTSFWRSGEPNNYGGNEHCVETNDDDNRHLWNDASCERENFWICENKTAPLFMA